MKNLPDQVIERLSLYRQNLAKYRYATSPHINSSDLARILNTSEENVRRDFMLIGCKSTTNRKGFSIPVLIEKISEILDIHHEKPANIAIIGDDSCLKDIMMNQYAFLKMAVAGVFDFCYSNVEINNGITYYPLDNLYKVVNDKNIVLAVLNTSAEYAGQISEILINAGIKGIVNFSPVKLNAPPHIYVDEINQITILEKAIFNIKKNEIQPRKI